MTTMNKQKMIEVIQPDGRLNRYPTPDQWDNWSEYDSKAWPTKKKNNYRLVPTICFNCESACGLLAYVNKDNYEIRKFEGNPVHPGSRGRNCAKGPATHNQVYDPERIMYPLKRVGARGEGKWKRVSWEEALNDVAGKMRASRDKRLDGIIYHVGRPGEDHYTNRAISAWGVDGHNSHTNICSAAARFGYFIWSAFDRPAPDHENAKVILLVSSHLETGHYFNPHAQRIIDAKMNGAKVITLDPRLSNTASKSNVWLPTWPGSEPVVLLSFANYLLTTGTYDREYVKKWVDWQGFLDYFTKEAGDEFCDTAELKALQAEYKSASNLGYDHFEKAMKTIYAPYTLERAAKEAEVPLDRLQETAEAIANCEGRLAAHVWRSAAMGNRGGWQVARTLMFLNVLTGSVGAKGGTNGNSWSKFVPEPITKPQPFNAWNELHLPHEWPMVFYEMSFLLPHFLEEGRGDIDVYFTRVYNPMWINPDGFMWMKHLKNEDTIKFHVALTPTWNESAWYADYVLPMGHSGERHDMMSQETHSGQWVGFRQPVRRVAMEADGKEIKYTYEANPGEVWEENELWVELSWRMDHDDTLGIRKHFESPNRPGEPITQDEYWSYIFENSLPGLPEAAKEHGLTPLQYMKKFGCYEVKATNYKPYEKEVTDGGIEIDGKRYAGFGTPSKKLEFVSKTVRDFGWPEKERVIPWHLESHVHQKHVNRAAGEMILLPNFRLPTLIHTRSANAKWLYEISHKNPIWINPEDANRLGVKSGDLLKVETEIGYFVDKAWVTHGIKPGVVACSHHLGRWRLEGDEYRSGSPGMTSLVDLKEDGNGGHTLRILEQGKPWKSSDPDTSRIWWTDVGVHQNLTHAVHPDPMSGAHCWLQWSRVTKAGANDQYGDVFVDTKKSMEVYNKWVDLTRSCVTHSKTGERRPYWFKRPLKPVREAYKIPENPFKRPGK